MLIAVLVNRQGRVMLAFILTEIAKLIVWDSFAAVILKILHLWEFLFDDWLTFLFLFERSQLYLWVVECSNATGRVLGLLSTLRHVVGRWWYWLNLSMRDVHEAIMLSLIEELLRGGHSHSSCADCVFILLIVPVGGKSGLLEERYLNAGMR